MASLVFVPRIPVSPDEGFVQSITLSEGATALGTARWFSSGNADGIAQLLDLRVFPPHQRIGHGKKLVETAIQQAREYHRRRGIVLRRLWVSVAQKDHINARAFLTSHGFHHVASVAELFLKQDALIYLKAFD